MKKTLSMLLILALALCGVAALAESDGNSTGTHVDTLFEEGSFIIQIPDVSDEGWWADDMAQDDSVVKLYDADILDGTFVARYDPVGDGDITVGVYHFYNAFACDEAYTWDLHVQDDAVQEVIGGSYTANPDEAEQDPILSGEWLEADTQFTRMTVAKGVERGWDVEITSPMTHGAYVFKTTVYPDCRAGDFVYDKGKYWDAPVDDADAPLGEAKVAGTTGSFTFDGTEDDIRLVWYDDERPEETVIFERAGGEGDVDTADWKYYTFEGSGVAMKLPPDFRNITDAPEAGIFYNAGNADVVLQVIPVDGDFEDRDALMEYYNTQEYVVRATQLTINGVELVYAEGADDGVMAYAKISAEGTTYCFAFIPQSDRGVDVIEAMTATICSSESVPEA